MADVAVSFDDNTVPSANLVLHPGRNLLTGERAFTDRFGVPTTLELDLLVLASAIFAADLATKRGKREEFTRKIELSIPVVNLAAFRAVEQDLRYALYVLSHDAWTLRFVPRNGTPEANRQWPTGPGKVLLFSGGLDSLAAAIDFGQHSESVQLVSHVTANQAVSAAQQGVSDYLHAQFAGHFDRLAFRVGGRNQGDYHFPSDQDREETQRTRSFLFLTLAAVTARRRGFHEIVVIAENGQMAIHLPLTAARISAFSTHTAHPEFVSMASTILSSVLGFQINISNPFLYLTKAEVVQRLIPNHVPAIEASISCWKASRVHGEKNHCGFCVPCIVRRIALEHSGCTLAEYARDIFTEDIAALPPDDDGKRNLMEVCEFATRFHAAATQAELETLYPEVLNEHIDAGRACAMYKRFSAEALRVLSTYPHVARLL